MITILADRIAEATLSNFRIIRFLAWGACFVVGLFPCSNLSVIVEQYPATLFGLPMNSSNVWPVGKFSSYVSAKATGELMFGSESKIKVVAWIGAICRKGETRCYYLY